MSEEKIMERVIEKAKETYRDFGQGRNEFGVKYSDVYKNVFIAGAKYAVEQMEKLDNN